MLPKVICLMGPTASGKTALACELIARYPMEIISVDSGMIYQGMNIGAAKPTAEELQQAPHHLIDIITPEQAYSAADFCSDTVQLCHEILQHGKTPLLVGGTMMYFNALQQGLSSLPESTEELRQELQQQLTNKGLSALYTELEQVDPQRAAQLHPNDTQRILRALEVYRSTGMPQSTYYQAQKQVAPFEFINLILFPQNRAWLHERIAQRFDLMLDEGFIDEVKELQKKWSLKPEMSSMRSVGYRQVLDYLHGAYDLATLREKGIAATRQLAKRQLTWLRHWDDARYFDPEDVDLMEQVIAFLIRFEIIP